MQAEPAPSDGSPSAASVMVTRTSVSAWWRALAIACLVVIAVCSVTMAPVGAATAHKLPVKQLKRVFATILYVLAAYMLYKGLSA